MTIKRIAIDGRELEGKPTGVGNYLHNILQHLSLQENWKTTIFYKNEIPAELAGFESVLLRSNAANLVWLHTTLASELRRRSIDLFFTPTPNCIPMFQGIQTATVHDLSYFLYPEWFSARDRWIRKVSTRYAFSKAKRIYVVSQHVKGEILQRFGVAEEKLLVTPNAVQEKKVDPELRNRLRKSHGYEDRRIILYVGSIFQRRHLPVLIQSLAELQPDVLLVVVGENRTYPRLDLKEMARKSSIESRVLFLEYASAKTLEDYYRMADVFIYLSTYEGFGVPPLEAMSHGVPVVLSPTPAMDEIYQYSALFVTDISPAAVADSLRACLNDPSLQERLMQSGLAQAARSSWKNTADIISSDWEQLLDGRS